MRVVRRKTSVRPKIDEFREEKTKDEEEKLVQVNKTESKSGKDVGRHVDNDVQQVFLTPRISGHIALLKHVLLFFVNHIFSWVSSVLARFCG